MSIFENPQHLKLLQNLLTPKENSSSDSEDESYKPTTTQNFGPGHFGNNAKDEKTKLNTNDKSIQQLPIDNEKDDIEKWLEKQEKEDEDILETRRRPEYKINYKQAIGTEDVFLQMNNRTAASMSCEDMIIEISMPEETVNVDEMDLKLTENEIDLKSSIYRLKLPLTHKIDPDKGNAKFDIDTKTLILTLRMKREFDFVNF